MTTKHSNIISQINGNGIINVEKVITKPVFVNKRKAAELFGVSKSTIYKWCTEAEESKEWPSLFIRPSATVTLIHVDTMTEFLKSKNKSFL